MTWYIRAAALALTIGVLPVPPAFAQEVPPPSLGAEKDFLPSELAPRPDQLPTPMIGPTGDPGSVPPDGPPTVPPTGNDPFGPLGGPLGGSSPFGGGFGGRGGMGGGLPGYDAAWYPSRQVRGQPTELGFVRQGVNIVAPLWRDGGDILSANLSVRNTSFWTNAVLPTSGRAFPDELWNIHLGLNYVHRFDNGWTAGLMTGIGSASDKPFHSINEINPSIGGFLRIPVRDGRDAWQVGLNYSPGGAVSFPLPMISYSWNPSDQLHVNVGLPFSLYWRPTEEWGLNLSYVPLYTITGRLTYRPLPKVQIYTGYDYYNEAYFLSDRLDNRDRFFLFEQRAISGVRWQLSNKTTLELNGGYAFGRYFGEGQSQFSSLTDRVRIAPGPFVGARLGIRF